MKTFLVAIPYDLAERLAALQLDLPDRSVDAIQTACTRYGLVREAMALGADEAMAFELAGAVAFGLEQGYVTYAVTSGITRCASCDWRKPEPLRTPSGRRKRSQEGRWGVDFAAGFVRINGSISAGCCRECLDRFTELLAELIGDRPIEVPKGRLPDRGWRRFEVRECSCGWTGPVTEMLWERTIMNDGEFPCACPSCRKKTGFLQAHTMRHVGHVVISEADIPPRRHVWDREPEVADDDR